MAGSLQEKTGAAAKHMQKHTSDCTALESQIMPRHSIDFMRSFLHSLKIFEALEVFEAQRNGLQISIKICQSTVLCH